MARDIQILDEVLGGPVHPRPSLAIRPAFDRCTVGDLIRLRVEQEAALGADALQRLLNPAGETPRAERLLNDAAARTRSFAGARQAVGGRAVAETAEARVARAVAEAQDAFAQGRFLMLLDDAQAESLDQEVSPSALDTVVFLRLTPLQGG